MTAITSHSCLVVTGNDSSPVLLIMESLALDCDGKAVKQTRYIEHLTGVLLKRRGVIGKEKKGLTL